MTCRTAVSRLYSFAHMAETFTRTEQSLFDLSIVQLLAIPLGIQASMEMK